METKKAFWLALILVIIFLSSCSKPIKLEEPLSFKRAVSNETKEREEKISEELLKEKTERKTAEPEPLALPSYKPQEIKKPLPPLKEKPSIDFRALVGVKEPLFLNVESMPLNEFIIYALGELLKVPFLMDENVIKMTNPVTLRLPRPLMPEEILEAVVSYLESQGLEVSQKGNVLSIVKPAPAKTPPVQETVIGGTPIETSAQIAQFVPLKFLKYNEIQTLLNDLIKSKNVEIKTYPKGNALLLIGTGYQMKQILEIVNLLDVPFFSEKKLYFYRITYWEAESFVKELSELLSNLGYPIAKNLNEPGVLFIPVKSLNSVIMAFPEEKDLTFTLEWIKKLDTPEAAGAETKFYIYKPLYSKASDLAESLGKLLAGQFLTSPSPQPIPQPAPQPTPRPAPTQRTSPPQATSISVQNINISADEKRNLLLISATPSQYQLILQVLKELDKPPKQVLIEATILELTLKDELKLGLEWYLKNRLAEGNYTLGQILGVPTGPGFTFTFITDSQRFNLLINAFASKGLTNILSTPRLMVLDNQAATIQVGTDVPVVTGEVTTAEAVAGATTGVVRSIQYRNTGVILTVKPTIYTEGLLQLEITQEVSEMGTAPPSIASPTILVRKINTNVVAGDGQTIVLGGLISNTLGREESKIPFLGDIPLLGNLFKSQSREERKTELIVLLTPHIIKNLEEAKDVTEELKSRLKWLK